MTQPQTLEEIDAIFDNLIETFEQELATNPLPNIHEFAQHCPESHRQELIGVLNLMVLMNATFEPGSREIDLESPAENLTEDTHVPHVENHPLRTY